MTAQNDLDRALAGWFGTEAAATPPPEPLARVIESTRRIRPRPALTARVGSHLVGAGSTNGPWSGLASLRPALVIALVALLAVALVGAAVLVGSRLVAPKTPPHTYVNELVSAQNLSMPMARPTLMPLLDGRVLVIGDDGDGGGTGTRALVYDPATGVSEPTGPLVSGDSLWVESAVRLNNGKVLIIGNGIAQVFDPSTMRSTLVGPMITPRHGAAVALLPDGHVLIAGGTPLGQDGATSSAELFDSDTLTFLPTGSMTTSRSGHSMAILPDGRVFVSPGESRMGVEIYDPSTGTFSGAGTVASYFHGNTAIALPDDRVAVLGGSTLMTEGFLELWDPASLTFSPGCRPRPCPLLSPDGGRLPPAEGSLPGRITSATLLDDGRLLLIGDTQSRANWSGVYDPATGVTTPISPTRSYLAKATRIPDGRVLIVGGLTDGMTNHGEGGRSAPAVTTVEIFQ